MADSLETLQTRLSEARDALHQLSIGQQVVEVERDGRRMKCTSADAGRLSDYVASLENQIADLTNAVSGALPRRRFISTRF